MDEDIVPALLETINKQFDSRVANDAIIKKALLAAKGGRATYADANKFAVEIGEVLSSVLGNNISSDALPDGRMYYNIGQRILSEMLKKNHDLVSGFSEDVQSQLNKKAGIGLKAQVPDFNQGKVSGMVNRLDSEANFDDVAWMLKEPIVNFSQCVVDDAVKKNVEFQAKAGLNPTITRRLVGKGCAWCRNLAGVYDYHDAPKNVYQRHENDRCIVEYDPGSGKRQNVWSKQWVDPKKKQQVEARAKIGLKTPTYTGPSDISAHKRGRVHPKALPNWQNAVLPAEKFTDYFLNVHHPKGGTKAEDFFHRLGYTPSNYRSLESQIRTQLPYYKATKSYKVGSRQMYVVMMPVTGPNHQTATVLTFWSEESDNHVRLTNAFIADARKRRKYK